MEQETRRSVAELAGKFTCQIPLPTGAEGNKPVRRRPPRTLQLPTSNNGSQGQEEQQKTEVPSQPPRKNRNSALIEKLQANLAISPTNPLLSPLSPGAVKPPTPSFSPHSPCSPVGQLMPSKPSQEEHPVSFETSAEGGNLKSINKGRARHSLKRRPPSRRLRKSSGDEAGTEEENTTVAEPGHAVLDEKENDVFEKQKVETEEKDETDSASATSEQPEEQKQSAESPDSAQKSETGEEKETKESVEEPVSAEKEEDEEEKSDPCQLESSMSESKETESVEITDPKVEPDTSTQDEENQLEKKEEEASQTEESKSSEQ
ncbi:duboraya [Trichomycterus rosablanca]|uniref:duboraya n=1 Tax=Trichomycterus rosablanca TaxID=2290929 RepID=UPI002F35D8D3